MQFLSLLICAAQTNKMCPSVAVNLTQPIGFLTSPNYPRSYYDDAVCQWRVIAQSAEKVSLHRRNKFKSNYVVDGSAKYTNGDHLTSYRFFCLAVFFSVF